MDITLYVIPGSHPCASVEAALDLKGLDYRRVDMLPGASPLLQLARFGKRTVPGLVVDGSKVSGSRLIMRTLEGLEPEPPLYPRDPEQAKAVAEAERWGERSLQTAARFVVALALTRHGAAGDTFLAEANVPNLPAPLSARATSAIFGLELRLLAGGLDGGRTALEKLPGLLDRVDALIGEGVIGGEQPNAADLQIAGSVRLLLNLADVRDEIDARPAGKLARRLIPHYPGEVPAGALPPAWIPSLESREPAVAATA